MQKLMYMKKHDQTICSSLKEVYNSVPCPNTLFLSPGNIYHTTWLGWAPLCILKIQIMPSVIRSMTASSQLHNFGSSRSAPRQAQPSPKCRHRAAGLSHCYPSKKKSQAVKQLTPWRTKPGPALALWPGWKKPRLSVLPPQARKEGSARSAAGTLSCECNNATWRLISQRRGTCAKKLSDPNPTLKPTVILSLSSSLLLTWCSSRTLRIQSHTSAQKRASRVSVLASSSRIQRFWSVLAQRNWPHSHQEGPRA